MVSVLKDDEKLKQSSFERKLNEEIKILVIVALKSHSRFCKNWFLKQKRLNIIVVFLQIRLEHVSFEWH
jgi:hypothetical protein